MDDQIIDIAMIQALQTDVARTPDSRLGRHARSPGLSGQDHRPLGNGSPDSVCADG
jgi:hypothetical protein